MLVVAERAHQQMHRHLALLRAYRCADVPNGLRDRRGEQLVQVSHWQGDAELALQHCGLLASDADGQVRRLFVLALSRALAIGHHSGGRVHPDSRRSGYSRRVHSAQIIDALKLIHPSQKLSGKREEISAKKSNRRTGLAPPLGSFELAGVVLGSEASIL